MIPTMVCINVAGRDEKRFKIVFPIVVIWILLLAIMLLFVPLMIIVSLIIWPTGYGRLLLLFPVSFFETIFAMRDLMVDVKSKNEIFYISFY